jgi:hypothetical protein
MTEDGAGLSALLTHDPLRFSSAHESIFLCLFERRWHIGAPKPFRIFFLRLSSSTSKQPLLHMTASLFPSSFFFRLMFLPEQLSIERAVVDRLGHAVYLDLLAPSKSIQSIVLAFWVVAQRGETW